MKTPRGARWASIALALGLVAAGAVAVAVVMMIQEFPALPVVPQTFTFAAAGDFGYSTSVDLVALAKRTAAANASFLLALGDLGYRADEATWCGTIKGSFFHVEVLAGNHDTNESPGGNITRYVTECPFTLPVGLTGDPATPGYGYGYYFDYPAVAPLARYILISPGVEGILNYNFSTGSGHTLWVESAVNDARARGIPWVIVGMHKMCITVGEKTYCEMGKAIFNKLVSLKVDLILQAHDHVYERSRQLALQPGCSSIRSDGGFNAACIVAEPQNDTYAKGVGSVVVVQGVGGRTHDNVTLNGTDAEIGYFVSAMGGNANTQNLSRGYGSVRYVVTRDRIDAATDLCPDGSPDANGSCAASAGTTFHDRFAIAAAASPSPSASRAPPHGFVGVVGGGISMGVIVTIGRHRTTARACGEQDRGRSAHLSGNGRKRSSRRGRKVYERWFQCQSG